MSATITKRKEVADRRREVEAMISLQVGSMKIQSEMASKYSVTTRTVRKDIVMIYERWEQEAGGPTKSKRNQMRQTLRTIMRKAMGAKDWKAAISACDRIMKLDGLFAPTVIEATTVTESRVELMTSDQQRKKLFAMADAAGVPLPVALLPSGTDAGESTEDDGGNGYDTTH